MKKSQRLDALKSSIFTKLYNDIEKYDNSKYPLIELGIGLTDFHPSTEVLNKLIQNINKQYLHDYPNTDGEIELLEAISIFYRNRFNVNINSSENIAVFHGSKEGMSKISFAFTDIADLVLIPNPAYSIFEQSSLLAQNTIHYLPLTKSNNFYPDFKSINKDILDETKILFLNYPNVPTTTNTSYNIFKEALDLAKTHDFLVVNDATYSNIYYNENDKPISILSIDGAIDRAIEFNSFSQSYRIAGWRLGYAVGNRENIAILKEIEDTLDSGVFIGFQKTIAEIISTDSTIVKDYNTELKKSRDLLYSLLTEVGFKPLMPKATYYMWVKLPEHLNSIDAYNIFKEYGILVMPGNGFGEYGEGYIRFCFARHYETIEEIKNRLQLIKKKCCL